MKTEISNENGNVTSFMEVKSFVMWRILHFHKPSNRIINCLASGMNIYRPLYLWICRENWDGENEIIWSVKLNFIPKGKMYFRIHSTTFDSIYMFAITLSLFLWLSEEKCVFAMRITKWDFPEENYDVVWDSVKIFFLLKLHRGVAVSSTPASRLHYLSNHPE